MSPIRVWDGGRFVIYHALAITGPGAAVSLSSHSAKGSTFPTIERRAQRVTRASYIAPSPKPRDCKTCGRTFTTRKSRECSTCQGRRRRAKNRELYQRARAQRAIAGHRERRAAQRSA